MESHFPSPLLESVLLHIDSANGHFAQSHAHTLSAHEELAAVNRILLGELPPVQFVFDFVIDDLLLRHDLMGGVPRLSALPPALEKPYDN